MNSRLAGVAPYRIRVRGELAEEFIQFGWSDRASMRFAPEPKALGVTTIEGDFDQAAQRGLLSYLCDMNLTVLCVDSAEAGTELDIRQMSMATAG